MVKSSAKILVVGSSGMVGSRFGELYSDKYNLLTPSYKDLDITDIESVQKYNEKNNPDTIVNFAAFTDVTEAENQRNQQDSASWKINVEGVKNLALVFSAAYLVHISTDMVFPGSEENKGPYVESSISETDPDKVTWYGYTKSQAENFLQKFHDNYAILRIIYPVRSKFNEKLDYLRKPLKLFDEDKLYPMFSDQQISISFIDEVCQTIDRLLETKRSGIFHCSSSNLTTPHELISYLLEKSRNKKDGVVKSSLSDFLKTVNNPVRYPKYGGLKSDWTSRELGTRFSTTEEIVNTLIKQGLEY